MRGEDAGPSGVGLRGDDSHDTGQYQRGTRGADAVPGPAGSIRGYRVVERSFHPGFRLAAGSPGPPVACLSVWRAESRPGYGIFRNSVLDDTARPIVRSTSPDLKTPTAQDPRNDIGEENRLTM